MKSAVLSAALACLAGPSLALSCLAPNVATSYNEAAASEKHYVVVRGTLTFDETELPEIDLNRQDQIPPHVDIEARLTGESLSRDGFKTRFDRPITLRSLCYGPWCGQAASGEVYLSFLEKSDAGYVLPVTPCGDYAFPEPTDLMMRQVTQCFRGDGCTP